MRLTSELQCLIHGLSVKPQLSPPSSDAATCKWAYKITNLQTQMRQTKTKGLTYTKDYWNTATQKYSCNNSQHAQFSWTNTVPVKQYMYIKANSTRNQSKVPEYAYFTSLLKQKTLNKSMTDSCDTSQIEILVVFCTTLPTWNKVISSCAKSKSHMSYLFCEMN
jgi:hypothetical protein